MGQHYVSRFYLRQWTTNNELYFLNLTTGRIRQCGVGGVANEELFYEIHELTTEEIDLVEHALIEPCSKHLRELQKQFLALYTLAPQLRRRLGNTIDPTFRSVLDEELANSAERHHKRIEDCLKPFLDSMLSGDVRFYSDAKQAAAFLYAICLQFTRTNRARQAAISTIGTKYKGVDAQRVWEVSSFVVAGSLGCSLYADRGNFRLVVLNNNTDTPFITGDQPIINLHPSPPGLPPDQLEFYYPLSPRKAMLLLEATNYAHSDSSVDAMTVNNYNVLIAKHAYEQIFSNDQRYLEVIRKC
jgi:hypothetical protein